MPATIAESFSRFKSNLEITNLQGTTVSVRQNGVRDVLKKGMTVLDDFLTGSYARSTMISPLKEADVDICAVLDVSYFHFYNGKNGGPAGLLDWVKRTLRQTYTRTPDISRNGQAVTIQFEDFVVDVVPAFYRQGGGYLIPNAQTNSWISTDPKKHVEIFSAANQTHNGDLVPLIKMLKSWNKGNGSFFNSFHLEVMVLQVLTNVRISDFPSGVRFFFDKARQVVGQQPDPAGFPGNVAQYLHAGLRLDMARRRLADAHELALRAENWGKNALYDRTSIDEWRKLFPLHFPAYG